MGQVFLITGTGFIASHLFVALREQGHEVRFLSTSKRELPYYFWDPEQGKLDEEALKDVSVILHLAGAGIADKRWTPKRKEVIRNSRVKSAELLLTVLKRRRQRVTHFISASAVGAYGAVLSNRIFKEEDAYAGDFLGETCRLWEEAAFRFQEEGIADYVSVHRFGLVLGIGGGAFPKLLLPFRWKVAVILGSGEQWLPWVALDDVCRQLLFAWEHNLTGAYNCVVDVEKQVTYNEFVKCASEVFHPWIRLRISEGILKLFLGEMGMILTKGSRISNEKIKQKGFLYKQTDLLQLIKEYKDI